MENGKKKIRVRNAPVRKWQRTEERSLIEFLKRNAKDLEKPTAQTFYKKFIDDGKITGIEWKLVRAKVRNMRISYSKAKQWQESPEAHALNGEGKVRDIVTKMCSFYDDFDEIYGGNNNGEVSFAFDSSVSSGDCVKDEYLSDDCQTSYSTEDMYAEPEMLGFANEDSNEVAMATQSSITQADDKHSTQFGDVGPFKKRKLDTTVQSLREEDLNLQRERLDFEKQKLKQEWDIKQREIDSQERLKILELEMKERIAMNELKMKERVALKALEKKWD